MEYKTYSKPLFVQKADLYCPDLSALVNPIKQGLKQYFKNVTVEVVDCPDLTKYGCAKPGICGMKTCIADVGGVPNLHNPQGHSIYFQLKEIAQACEMKDPYIIGAGASAYCLVGKNAEWVCCDDLKNPKNRKSVIAKLSDNNQEQVIMKPECDKFGMLGNLFLNEGLMGQVLKVKVSKKIKEGSNFISIIRENLKKVEGYSSTQQIGMSGVFLVNKGQIKSHIMEDFVNYKIEDKDVGLKFFNVGPQLTCFPVFVTGDPLQGNLNLRLEHTHFFSQDGKCGGHYHHTTTPDTIEYEGYFNLAQKVYRINNAFQTKWIKPGYL